MAAIALSNVGIAAAVVASLALLFWMIGKRRRDVLHGPYDTKEQPMEAEVTKKVWDDPQLDAAQFAIDRFLNAKQTVSDKMSEIYQSIQDGSATDEDRKRLKVLREQYIALSKEVEDMMGRLLIGKHLHHS